MSIATARTMDEIADWCARYLVRTLGINGAAIGLDRDFDALGVDSAVKTAMVVELEAWLGAEIDPSALLPQRSLRQLATTVVHCLRDHG